ncbi:LOW QUALITY PROTEIN: hypothetical protein OSB04_029762 [Centaurea solstitialis]|uniref:Glycosyltransferases n=1 Tax=Centaurea solstitialis TaxID=347529 RepID=A0AA38S5J4_9ASTR|nr:LOW QUALITY PROTEIN: hypothetical protein OSB04_029762 [Centaurea solstitialis]
MTTIRRTLSPVPRAGTVLGFGEASSVASPLSKCSSCNHDYDYTPSPTASVSGSTFEFGLYRFHLFVGFTPIVSVKNSTNLVSRNQAFSFEQSGKVRLDDVVSYGSSGTLAPSNVTIEKQENGTSNGVLNDGFDDKFLIVVTPTYPRMFQSFYLTVWRIPYGWYGPPLLWIVVEMTSQSSHTSELLRRSGVTYRHLVCTKNVTEVKDPRVHQRNVALLHIETHRFDGIVYFADDINIYSTQLFDHMRQIKRFGTWPVAKLKKNTRVATFVGPICNGTQVIGWHTNDVMRRFLRFHADLSGFAFNSTILWDPKKWHRPTIEPIRQLDTVKDGFQVSSFIEQVVEDETEMEGIPEECSKVLVWHAPMGSSPIHPQEWSFNANLDAILPLTLSI